MVKDPSPEMVDSSTAGKFCSICQTALIAGETMARCPDCDLLFHLECWQENRGCGQYGCKSAPETVKSDSIADFQNDIWGNEKPCPKCNNMIKAKAQKCRFCGAKFEDRGFISKEKYATREYSGKEYDIARNKIFGLFLAGATGLLAPLVLPMLLYFYCTKSFFGMDYRRLPSSLKLMVLVSLGVESFLVLVLALLIIFD